MRGCVHIGVHAKGDTRLASASCRERIDQSQFGFRLAIEASDVLFERVIQLSRGFSDAGEDNFSGITAGLEDAEQLATGNDVEARARVGQEFQDGGSAV